MPDDWNPMPFEPYYAFLLRMWRPDPKNPARWRVILENPHTREVVGFEGLQALFAYLEALAESGDQGSGYQETGNQEL